MAQMPIQMISGRADPFAAASPAVAASPSRVAMPRAAYLYDPGGISGGKLRPGSIDQEQFKAYLAAARKETAVAPATPLAAPASAPAVRGIPTLSPAQLAALGIDVTQLPSPEMSDAAALGDPASLATAAGGAPSDATPDARAGEIAGNAYAPDPTAPDVSASEVADAVLNARAQSAALPPATEPAASHAGERGPRSSGLAFVPWRSS